MAPLPCPLCQPQDQSLCSHLTVCTLTSCCMSRLLQTGPVACQAASATILPPRPWFQVSHMLEWPKNLQTPAGTSNLEHHKHAPPGDWVRLAPPFSPGFLRSTQVLNPPQPQITSGHQTLQGFPDVLLTWLSNLQTPVSPVRASAPRPMQVLALPEAGVIHLLWGASPHPDRTSHPMATKGPIDLSTCRKWITNQTHETIVEALVHPWTNDMMPQPTAASPPSSSSPLPTSLPPPSP